MAAVTIYSDFGAPPPPKIKSDAVSTVSPSICHEVMGLQMVTAAMKLKDAYSLEEKL